VDYALTHGGALPVHAAMVGHLLHQTHAHELSQTPPPVGLHQTALIFIVNHVPLFKTHVDHVCLVGVDLIQAMIYVLM
jgi:hypothetical protein